FTLAAAALTLLSTTASATPCSVWLLLHLEIVFCGMME
ncbi:MAG: hypothetical protein ACI8QT_002260, partial [Halioglobus sp.]